MFFQLISVVGAALILVAYVANQRKLLTPAHRSYNVMNFVGSGLLAWVAIVDQRLGFIILEVVWALASVPGMVKRGAGITPPASPPADSSGSR